MQIKTSGYNWSGKTLINNKNYKVGNKIFDKKFKVEDFYKSTTINFKNKYYFCHLYKIDNKLKIGRLFKINKSK
jgi:hypothetical protein